MLKIYSLDNERHYCSASCYSINNEVEEIKVTKPEEKGEYRISMLSHEDFGPQRFEKYEDSEYGVRQLIPVFETQNNVPFWINQDGEEVEKPITLFVERSETTMEDLRKRYKFLRGKDEEWMIKNKDVLKKIYSEHSDDAGSEEGTRMSYSEDIDDSEFNEDSVVDGDDFGSTVSLEHTEMTKEQINFWGYGNSKSSVIWSAIRYSVSNAIERVMRAKDAGILSEDELEWLREVFTGMKSLPRKVQWFLSSNRGTIKKRVKGFYGYSVMKDWLPRYCRGNKPE